MKHTKVTDEKLEAFIEAFSQKSDEEIEMAHNIHLNKRTHRSDQAKALRDLAATRGITLSTN